MRPLRLSLALLLGAAAFPAKQWGAQGSRAGILETVGLTSVRTIEQARKEVKQSSKKELDGLRAEIRALQQTLRNESDAHYAALEHEREEAREQIRTMRVQLKEATMEVRRSRELLNHSRDASGHLEREVRQARFEGGVRTKHILLAVVFMLTLVVIAATAVWAMLRGRKPTDVLSESEKARVQRAMLLVKQARQSSVNAPPTDDGDDGDDEEGGKDQ
mmetsp:Transcript_16975/g.49195  ORF Transcript_16975/g.49195 Transcript_16975/m.49195 type:complete len:218 (+) Transcript_16975:88-741(+)